MSNSIGNMAFKKLLFDFDNLAKKEEGRTPKNNDKISPSYDFEEQSQGDDDSESIPLIVGYSAFVDQQVLKNAYEVGFDRIFETPLSVPKIKEML